MLLDSVLSRQYMQTNIRIVDWASGTVLYAGKVSALPFVVYDTCKMCEVRRFDLSESYSIPILIIGIDKIETEIKT